jgi:hypothetical protein
MNARRVFASAQKKKRPLKHLICPHFVEYYRTKGDGLTSQRLDENLHGCGKPMRRPFGKTKEKIVWSSLTLFKAAN